MENSRLVRLLKRLRPGEMKRFMSFLESPYFNRNERILQLGELLRDCYPLFQGELIRKSYLLKTLFGRVEATDEAQFHNLNSQMLRLLEQFMGQQAFEQDSDTQTLYLLRSLANRDETDHFNRVYQKHKKTDYAATNINAYLSHYLIENQAVALFQRQRKRNLNQDIDQLLINLGEELDVYFLISRLKLACEIQNRGNILQSDVDQSRVVMLAQQLVRLTELYPDVPMVAGYASIFQMLQGEAGETHFQNLVVLLEEKAADIPANERKAMYTFAQNYCIRQINQGKSVFLGKLFNLYQKLLEEGLLIESDGFLAHWNYKNITTLGLRQEAFDWVEDFLEKYRSKLQPEIRENAYNYNLASFYYETKDFTAAKRLIRQVEFTDVYYHLSAKSILLKIYFEIEDEDALLYHIQAFQVFLRRNKHISKSHYTIHHNLVRFAKQAARLRGRRGFISNEEFQRRSDALTQKIRESEGVANARWLLRMIQQMNPVLA
ncbi:MAG: hypothetical protein AAF206_18345 [Bacteroidota bacterium]